MSAENHELRRKRIAEVTLRVIAREGLDAATVRRIAAEAGYSTSIVTHYFANKDDLLLSAYQAVGDMNDAKFARYMAASPPDLLGYLMSMTAVGEGNDATWRVWISSWERALRDPVFIAELRAYAAAIVQRIERFLLALEPRHAAPDRAAARLFALVQGLSTDMLLEPERWSPSQVRDALVAELACLLDAPERRK